MIIGVCITLQRKGGNGQYIRVTDKTSPAHHSREGLRSVRDCNPDQ